MWGFFERRAVRAPDGRTALGRLRLLRSRRIGPATWRRLMEAAEGDPDAAFELARGAAREAGIKDWAPAPEGVARAEMRAAHRAGAVALWCDDARFPPALAAISDAPALLWVRGDVTAQSRVALEQRQLGVEQPPRRAAGSLDGLGLGRVARVAAPGDARPGPGRPARRPRRLTGRRDEACEGVQRPRQVVGDEAQRRAHRRRLRVIDPARHRSPPTARLIVRRRRPRRSGPGSPRRPRRRPRPLRDHLPRPAPSRRPPRRRGCRSRRPHGARATPPRRHRRR